MRTGPLAIVSNLFDLYAVSQTYSFLHSGALPTGSSTKLGFTDALVFRAGEILALGATLETPPSGGAVVVAILVNDVNVGDLTIPDGQSTAINESVSIALAKGDRLNYAVTTGPSGAADMGFFAYAMHTTNSTI